jgi:hypothetical protein
MDEQAQAIGGRVRYWRQRRQLDRKRFADMVDRSTSWLDKVVRHRSRTGTVELIEGGSTDVDGVVLGPVRKDRPRLGVRRG